MTRKTITIDEDLHTRLADRKGDDESWSDLLRRLEDVETQGREAECSVNALTEDHIDDIAAAVSRRTADELETRLR